MSKRSFYAAVLSSLFVVPVSALALETQAGTISVQPNLNAPICLKREYTDEHLRNNPKQLLTSMYVLLTKESKKVNGDRFTLNGAEVYGEKDGHHFSNREAICEFEENGSARCFVECDGGSFHLKPRRDSADFLPHSSFPLFLKGFNRATAGQRQTLELHEEDRHNNVYRLYPTSVDECRAVQKRAIKVETNC